MTYLNLVNAVLRRLRESTVSTVAETDYSAMIGDFVNDARVLVAAAHEWTELRSRITINTVADDDTYSLTGYGHSGEILNIWNDTSDWEVLYQTNEWFDKQNLLNTALSQSPNKYTFVDGLDGNGDVQIQLYPIPDDVYTLYVDSVIRDNVLSSDSDTLAIPENPVIHLALAFAARERGETGGTSTQEYFEIANNFLSDAIAIDVSRHPEEFIWYTP